MRHVDVLRGLAAAAKGVRGVDVRLTPSEAEALCDLADAADEHFQVELDHERSSSFDRCTRCGCEWPCPTERMRAALARLDGEDTG